MRNFFYSKNKQVSSKGECCKLDDPSTKLMNDHIWGLQKVEAPSHHPAGPYMDSARDRHPLHFYDVTPIHEKKKKRRERKRKERGKERKKKGIREVREWRSAGAEEIGGASGTSERRLPRQAWWSVDRKQIAATWRPRTATRHLRAAAADD
ncbi:hypothetical protein Scep_012585 [Stephania cephalantha]|uniref:Uncharacterized protein n=1 Tax=Stephania cephalantha TaxID=152367 RepID=A0AAP0P6L7_9MAGN